MSGDAAQQEIVRLVREELLFGSDRPIPVDAPLGELGIGLDSLALVKLLTAVENTFGVEVDDDVWVARGPLTVDDLAEIVTTAPERNGARPAELTLVRGRMERAEQALAGGGLPRRAAWSALRLVAPVKEFLFGYSRTFVLERDLDGAPPELEPPPGVTLRPYAPDDDLVGLWPGFAERHGRRFLRRQLADGALALVATEESRVVALDLLSATGEDEVRVVWPNRCFGYWLTEAPSARGRGIGLALVAYSLRVAREVGFRTQVTWVAEDNAAMLAAATQLLGFRSIGTASRLRVLGLTRWSWEIKRRAGRGPKLLV